MNTRPQKRRDEGEDDAEPCSFCKEKPLGSTGHEGLALDVKAATPSLRRYECFTCFFCGTRWARRRLSAKQFDWLRVAD